MTSSCGWPSQTASYCMAPQHRYTDTPLTDDDRARYEWQMWVPALGEEGQQRLKAATVFISRCGGIGGLVALQLAAAGVGRLLLAHGGVVLRSDLNRQLLMTESDVGNPRMPAILARLRALNPTIDLIGVPENINAQNVERITSGADIFVDAAPLFEERLLLNRESVRRGIPMVECAMYEWSAYVTTFVPGETGCLACMCPDPPPEWRREFPVIGAVSGTAACLGAVEVIKCITGIGVGLKGRLLTMDLSDMRFREMKLRRNPNCTVCSHVQKSAL